jgi:arabinosaccharide transport system substrate-binding protein
MFKKSGVLLMVILLVVGFVSTVSAQKVELEFWTFVSAHADYYEMKAEEFNELHPDIEFVFNTQTFPWEQMHDKLNIALQTGIGVPDVVDIEISKLATILSREETGLLGLNSLVDEYKDDLVMARFTPYTKDDIIYGIPTHIGTGVIFYNKALFDEAGVSVDDIKTWDDYVEAGKKLTKDTDGDGKIDQWMSPVCNASAWPFHMMARQLGSDLFNEDGDLIIDREENVRVLELMQDLVYKYEIGSIVGHYEEPTFHDAINKGTYASLLPMPSWHMSRFTQFAPELAGDIVVRPIPAWSDGGSRSAMGGGTMTSITEGANNIEVAKEFLVFAKMTTQAGIDIWETLNFDPIVISAYEAPELSKPLPYFGNEVVLNVIQKIQSEIQPLYLTNLYPRANNILQSEVIFETIEQNMDPAVSLKKAAEKIKSEI